MRPIAWLLRVFSYLFHTILSLALLGLGVVAIKSGVTDMKVEMLPWHGASLNWWAIGLGVFGLLSVLLAVTGRLRLLLPLWSIAVVAVIVRGVFLSSAVTFAGREDFHSWMWVMGGAVVAMIGSFTLLGRRSAY